MDKRNKIRLTKNQYTLLAHAHVHVYSSVPTYTWYTMYKLLEESMVVLKEKWKNKRRSVILEIIL